MNAKHKSREVALQILFQRPFSPESDISDLLIAFNDSFALDQTVRSRAEALAVGVENKKEEVNQIITQHSDNWRIDRMALTDLIILQLGVFELVFFSADETPPKLCINDYIDIAKKYSSAEAKNFINGILDRVYHQHLGGQ